MTPTIQLNLFLVYPPPKKKKEKNLFLISHFSHHQLPTLTLINLTPTIIPIILFILFYILYIYIKKKTKTK